MAKDDVEDIVKKPHTKSDFTKQRLKEITRCVEDPMYFMENFMKIQHPIRGAIPFEPYEFQKEMIRGFHENRFTVALTARQMGKMNSLDTPILTPTGFKTLGDLAVGDVVYGDDGKPTTITFMTETMYDKDCFDVQFEHGETILSGGEHLWTVEIRKRHPDKEGSRWEVKTIDTYELKKLVESQKSKKQAVSIRVGGVVQFPEQLTDNEIDFYTYGVWLGDGCSWNNTITCTEEDYVHYATKIKASAWRPTRGRTGVFNIADKDFNTFLKTHGLRKVDANRDVYSKSIPQFMLMSSEYNRMELLRGLMDTDGTVEKNGVSRFYQSNEEMIDQVRFLLSSLGIKSTKRVKKTTHKDCFILTFCTTKLVTSLPRKAERLARVKSHPKNERFYISEVIPRDSVPCKCIQVDNESHLYLAGRTLVPTHNTTCAAGYLLWKAMFTPSTTILITANKLVQALEIMDRIRFAYQNLPDYIRAGVVEYNKGTITFDNDSKIVSRATSSDAGRGLSITLLYCDEFAFVPPNKATEFWTSIQPVLSTGGACIITSTPKSDEDQFAQIYKGALQNTDEYGNLLPGGRGKGDWFALTIPWDRHPERNEEWAKPFRESLGEARFAQEFECDFVTSDETLINPLKLRRMDHSLPIGFTGSVRWYKDIEPNKTYMVALDPAIGYGGDDAAIQVFQLPEMVQVAEWQHNLSDTRAQIRRMMQILMFIEGEMLDHPDQIGSPEIYWTVENNTLGEAALLVIEETGEERFPGMFVTERKRKGQSRRFRKGFNTDNRKKLSACARFKSLVESDRMTIHSQQLVRQLKNYVHKEASFAAKPGEKDDLVSASLLIVRMLDVVLGWTSNDGGDLREHISDEELYAHEPMPISL